MATVHHERTVCSSVVRGFICTMSAFTLSILADEISESRFATTQNVSSTTLDPANNFSFFIPTMGQQNEPDSSATHSQNSTDKMNIAEDSKVGRQKESSLMNTNFFVTSVNSEKSTVYEIEEETTMRSDTKGHNQKSTNEAILGRRKLLDISKETFTVKNSNHEAFGKRHVFVALKLPEMTVVPKDDTKSSDNITLLHLQEKVNVKTDTIQAEEENVPLHVPKVDEIKSVEFRNDDQRLEQNSSDNAAGSMQNTNNMFNISAGNKTVAIFDDQRLENISFSDNNNPAEKHDDDVNDDVTPGTPSELFADQLNDSDSSNRFRGNFPLRYPANNTGRADPSNESWAGFSSDPPGISMDGADPSKDVQFSQPEERISDEDSSKEVEAGFLSGPPEGNSSRTDRHEETGPSLPLGPFNDSINDEKALGRPADDVNNTDSHQEAETGFPLGPPEDSMSDTNPLRTGPQLSTPENNLFNEDPHRDAGGFPLGPPPSGMGRENPPLLSKPPSSISRETMQRVKLGLSLTSILMTVTGVTLNIPSLVVFKRSPITVTNKLMIALLSLETACLVVNLPICLADILHIDDQFLPLPLTYYRVGSELTFLVAMRRTIIFLTMVMTLDRFLTSVFPLLMREKKLVKRPNVAITLVVSVTLAYCIVEMIFRWNVIKVPDPAHNSTLGLIIPTEEFRTNVYLLSFFVITNILCQYVPTFTLTIANLGLLLYLVHHKMRMRKNDIWTTAANQNRASPTRSVGIVFVYSVVTLALNMPIEIYMSQDVYGQIDAWAKGELPENKDLGLVPVIYSCVNVLSWSVDFFIYWFVSSRFRESTKKLFGITEELSSRTRNTNVS